MDALGAGKLSADAARPSTGGSNMGSNMHNDAEDP